MKRTLISALAAGVALSAIAVGPAKAGNGAPQGAHEYQLNIIGTSEKNPNLTGGEGHRIFVPLDDRTKILLSEGDYAVLDANGTDGSAAFQLPAPGYDAHLVGDPGDADVTSSYSVFIRPLGKPGGWATITTCAELLDTTFADLLPGQYVKTLNRAEGDALCSIEQVGADVLTRQKGKSSFTNVTPELTSVVFRVVVDVDTNGDEVVDEDDYVDVRVPLFDDIMENEYWEYDNSGLRLSQVRFYDCSTNVDTGESTC